MELNIHMHKIWGIGICPCCNHQTEWYDTITEKASGVIVRIGPISKHVASYTSASIDNKYVVTVICEKCSNHYCVSEYNEVND